MVERHTGVRTTPGAEGCTTPAPAPPAALPAPDQRPRNRGDHRGPGAWAGAGAAPVAQAAPSDVVRDPGDPGRAAGRARGGRAAGRVPLLLGSAVSHPPPPAGGHR